MEAGSPVQTVLELLGSLLWDFRIAPAMEHEVWLSQAVRWALIAFYFKSMERFWEDILEPLTSGL